MRHLSCLKISQIITTVYATWEINASKRGSKRIEMTKEWTKLSLENVNALKEFPLYWNGLLNKTDWHISKIGNCFTCYAK